MSDISNRSSDVSVGGITTSLPRRFVGGIVSVDTSAEVSRLGRDVEVFCRKLLPPFRSRLLVSHFRADCSMVTSVSSLNLLLFVLLTASAPKHKHRRYRYVAGSRDDNCPTACSYKIKVQ